MKYKLLKVDGLGYNTSADIRLEDEVNRHIENGWKPQGGVGITLMNGRYVLYQAMIKEETKPEPEEPKAPTVIQL